MRLADSAPALVAAERGIFTALGLDVSIEVEPSWANIADKLTYGLLDAASILPPLALAAAMGLRGPTARLLVPMSLSQGGNAIVLGTDAMAGLSGADSVFGWLRGLEPRPRFGVVHAFSTHNLLLRYWLAASGVDPDRDIDTVAVPPAGMVEALAAGRIAGFCAGAPWGDLAVEQGVGAIVTGTSSIWPHHPEKCLAVGAAWAEANPDTLQLLMRGLLRAQILCDDPLQGALVAALLAREDQLGLPEAATRAVLAGGEAAERVRFGDGSGWFPARAHALWFLGQMQRWGWIGPDAALTEVADRVYRPDLLSPALAAERILLPHGGPGSGNDLPP